MLNFLRPIFKLQFLLVILAVVVGIYYSQILSWYRNLLYSIDNEIPVSYANDDVVVEKLFTKEDLAIYNGEDGKPLYLGLLGSVFDVSKGAKHYGPGCGYNFFVGRDASVSFITGEFENYIENEADNVLKLSLNDLIGLDNWKKFYYKDYTYVGKLIGRFYESSGAPTVYHEKYLALLDQAKQAQTAKEQNRQLYPDCNLEWNAETSNTRVWCTTNSGGKERNWAGYPRKLFELGSDSFRCACINEDKLDTKDIMIKSYDNCESKANECFYHVD